jgi:FkbM family methyltransferase
MNPARRGGRHRRTGRDEIGLFVEWEGGERFYFNHHLLHNRYVWPDGLASVHRLLLEKYQDGPVTIEPGDIIIEAGANVGELTTAAAPRARHLHVFEPDPMTFGCLTRNAAHLPNVTLHHAGLGDFQGQSQLYLSRENSDSSFIRPEKYVGVVQVPITTVAAVMDEHGLRHVDFLKLEAEGFEPEILAGCGKRLADIRKVAVDCGPERQGANTYSECEALLRDAGFRTWRRERDWMLFGTTKDKG